MNDLDTIKAALYLCESKGWTDVIRLLDQSEVLDKAWGAACILQVLDYETGKWITCALVGKKTYSMAHLYLFIRSELKWDGPVRVAVAAK